MSSNVTILDVFLRRGFVILMMIAETERTRTEQNWTAVSILYFNYIILYSNLFIYVFIIESFYYFSFYYLISVIRRLQSLLL